MERSHGRKGAETPSIRDRAFIIWLSAGLATVLICTMTYRYNVDFDIGVNHGIMSMWYAVADLPFYVALPMLAAWLLTRALRPLIGMRMLIALLAMALLSYLLIDLHYWRYPSPVLEYSWSDLWSRLLN